MMQKRTAKRTGQKPRSRVFREQGLGAVQSIPHPPLIQPQIRHHQRLRFVTNAAVSASITFGNLLDALLVASSATQGYQVFDQVKVKAVECWAIAAIGTSTTVTVSFPGNTGGDAGDGRVLADTSVSTEPAHVYAKPAKLSAAAMWQSTASGMNAVSFIGPTGMIVDVEVAYRNTDSAPTVVTNALVAAVTGQFYYRGLDGLPIASTQFVPQATNTR
jgi:hypothetical protein